MTSLVPVVAGLRSQLESMQGRAERQPVATHPALSGLLSLRSGGVYTATVPTLAMLLMAGPSASGAWSAVVGAPAFGAQAAAELGIDLARVVAVPRPQVDPIAVIGALIDVVDVLAVAPGVVGRLTPRDSARLGARLRERRCLIVTWGDRADVSWPRPEARLDWSDVVWRGLGHGHGHLQARQATVAVRRADQVVGERRLWLPGPDLGVREVEPPARLRRVG